MQKSAVSVWSILHMKPDVASVDRYHILIVLWLLPLLRTLCVPGTILSVLPLLTHLTLTGLLWGRYYSLLSPLWRWGELELHDEVNGRIRIWTQAVRTYSLYSHMFTASSLSSNTLKKWVIFFYISKIRSTKWLINWIQVKPSLV